MIKYRIAVIVALLLIAVSSSSAQTKWKRVSSFQLDWDGHRDVQAVLEIPSAWSDPGDFTRIRIRVEGQKEFVLKNDKGWVKASSEEAALSPVLKKTNALHSEYLLALRIDEHRILLFLIGYPYASSPGSLDVLEMSNDGQARVILHRDELGLREVRDLDGDGIAEVVGYPCLSQEWGNGLLTYDPFNVYKLGALPDASAVLSLPLSKAYNLKHYYGWAGAKCSEEFAVVMHPPKGGKPIVMKAKDAEKLTGGK